jgi:hypothetical protein
VLEKEESFYETEKKKEENTNNFYVLCEDCKPLQE